MNRIALAILLCLPAVAAPRLPAILSDHMVLQQGRAVPVWGWADPGERIAVAIAGQTRDTAAGKDGRWRVDIGPLPAGGPFQLTVTGSKTLILNDVLVGEVWLCSGQSNMAFPLSRAETAKEDIAAANQPRLRLFTAARQDRTEPAEGTVGAWTAAAPDTVRDFSAVAYYFGSEIQRRLNVPVGVVHSSWSGSVAEQWTDGAWLRSDPEFAEILSAWEQMPAEIRDMYRKPAPYRLELDDFEFMGGGGFADFDGASDGEWTFDWNSPGALTFDLVAPGRGGRGFAGRIAGPFGPTEGRTLRFRFRKPADTRGYSGIRFWARGQGFFKVHVTVPTVTDSDNYATTVFKASGDWAPVEIPFSELKQAGWGRKLPFTPEAVSGLAVEPMISPAAGGRPPSGLYNGMIRPLAPFGIRGAVWYQGEGNSGRAYQYRKLLPALIRNWRETWGEGDFPFLIVQLPNYGRRAAEPGESRWAELREAQAMTLSMPQTGLAVTIDLGEGADVHPKRKKEVGHRLALTALGQFYGEKIVYSGPVFEWMRVEGGEARVKFRTGGPGLVIRGNALKGFAIAGADRKFVWADARIEGDSVVVSSPRVAAPVAARYAWDSDPVCNLYNADGLPARPFRTDEWQ